MNNDSTTTPAAAEAPTTSSFPDTNELVADTAESQQRAEDALTPVQKRFQVQTRKRLEFVKALADNIDMLIYAELCILYYMDCSFWKLLIRVMSQMIVLTRPAHLAIPRTKLDPNISGIFGPNLICILFHLLPGRPEAGEAMRGYLHGGIIIDLIGQKGPTSRLHLFLLDVLVMVLQCVMVAVLAERERLNTVLAALLTPNGTSDHPRVAVVPAQDHDAEERGVIRDNVMDDGQIEMQPIVSPTGGPSSNQGTSPDETITRFDGPPSNNDSDDEGNALDVFYSGSAVIVDLYVLETLRKQWANFEIVRASESTVRTVGFGAGYAAATANGSMVSLNQRWQALRSGA